MMIPTKPKFPLGQVVATPGALEALRESGQTPAEFLSRHSQGDWGNLSDHDKRLNDEIADRRRPNAVGIQHQPRHQALDHHRGCRRFGPSGRNHGFLPEEY